MSKKQNRVSEAKTGDYGYRSETRNLSKSSSKKRKSGGGKALGVILVMIQLILSIVFTGLIVYKKLAFLTAPVLAGVIGVLIVFLGLVFSLLQKSGKAPAFGKVISVIVIIILSLLIYLVAPIPQMSGSKVSKDPFIVVISAADTFGELNSKENTRTDTNILAVVNPKTYSVLMISTPRDYYVPVQAKSVAPESYDKLTHVTLYGNGIAHKDGKDLTSSDWQWAYEVQWHPGQDALMDTLKYLYKYDIKKSDYHYAKVNFTGFADLIDALGGVTVNVEIPFSTEAYASYDAKHEGSKIYTYKKGNMEMDGATALTYARERHSFANGDMQRNRNQVAVLKALEKKLLSGTMLINYNKILDAIKGSFSTDLDISSLANMQLSLSTKKDYNGWNIMSYSVTGQTSWQTLTYTGSSKSVVLQDEQSVSNATNLINMVLNGDDASAIKKQIKKYNK